MWASFVERQDLFMNDGLYLSGKGAAVLGTEFVRCINEGTGTVECLNYVHRGDTESHFKKTVQTNLQGKHHKISIKRNLDVYVLKCQKNNKYEK